MDVFPGSQGLGALGTRLDTLAPGARRAVLIPTAGNPMPKTPWVDVPKATMTVEGLSVRRLDLQPATPEQVSAALADADLVFVTGGYPIYYWPYPGLNQSITTGLIIGQGRRTPGFVVGHLLKFFPMAYFVTFDTYSEVTLPVPEIHGDGCHDIECQVGLHVNFASTPATSWPELPDARGAGEFTIRLRNHDWYARPRKKAPRTRA
jgi:hypothetical protein